MVRILRSQKEFEIEEEIKIIEEKFRKSFDYNGNFLLFPIRHHSPMCSFHLEKVIEKYKPDLILIEGPKNASFLIEKMVSQNTKPPFCLYSSYNDKDGKISEEKEKYRVFYPFLEYSPEYVAMKKGDSLGIKSEFIDFSYGEKLLNTPKIERSENEEDEIFISSNFYQKLVERMKCKNFNELWEMLFEVGGAREESEEFVRNLFYYCWYSRKELPENYLIENGDIMREYFMAKNILEKLKTNNKILVVTGGIHTINLVDLLSQELPEKNLKNIKDEDSPNYIIPYSFEESDRNYGYESGMIFPFFYQKVWENRKKEKPFEETVLRFIVNVARELRGKQPISLSDEMQSFYMAQGLAELREKEECGVFELIDGVKSSFVKGELNSYYQPVLDKLFRLMTGVKMGEVDLDSGLPPIILDFQEKCKKFRIDLKSVAKKESKLDIYTNEGHREKSQFFHQVQYLKVGFCRYLRGHSGNGGKGRILLRESWEYKYSTQVQTELIKNSAYGGSVEEAVIYLLKKEIESEHINSKELSEKIILSNKMGLDFLYDLVIEKLFEIIGNDMDFISVSKCFLNLNEIKRYNKNFKNLEIDTLDNLIELCLNRLETLIYTVINMKKDDEDEVTDQIKYIYSFFLENEKLKEKKNFEENMLAIYKEKEANSSLVGIATGILLKNQDITLDETMEKINQYIIGMESSQKMLASFLKGFFKVAKDIIFIDDRLINSLNAILKEIDTQLFLEILPDLRLAFTQFIPIETNKIAKKVAEIYDTDVTSILYEKKYSQEEIDKGVELDKYCREMIDEWLYGVGIDE